MFDWTPPNEAVVTKKAYFDIEIDGKPVGRLVMGLYGDAFPKTVENFMALCTGEKGVGENGKPLHYKGSKFYRVIRRHLAEGGDIINQDGSGGESIYGPDFRVEGFNYTFNQVNYLAMKVDQSDMWNKNKIDSKFFFALQKAPWMNNNHALFGELLEGQDVLKKIEKLGNPSGKVYHDIVIAESGVLPDPEPAEKKEL